MKIFHPLYTRWASMKSRCYQHSHESYPDYGGRGIIICDRWLDFDNFVADMYPTFKEGLELDRIDNDGNYEPSNVRWTTHSENQKNKRKVKHIEESDHIRIPLGRDNLFLLLSKEDADLAAISWYAHRSKSGEYYAAHREGTGARERVWAHDLVMEAMSGRRGLLSGRPAVWPRRRSAQASHSRQAAFDIGHGGFARKATRLVRIEEAESPEEVIAEIERVFAETPKKVGRKPKTVTTAQKPLETPSVDYKQWLDYYQQQAQALREQEAMNDLLAQAKLKLQALQEQETRKRLEEYQAMLQMQQEEELLLLLMAA